MSRSCHARARCRHAPRLLIASKRTRKRRGHGTHLHDPPRHGRRTPRRGTGDGMPCSVNHLNSTARFLAEPPRPAVHRERLTAAGAAGTRSRAGFRRGGGGHVRRGCCRRSRRKSDPRHQSIAGRPAAAVVGYRGGRRRPLEISPGPTSRSRCSIPESMPEHPALSRRRSRGAGLHRPRQRRSRAGMAPTAPASSSAATSTACGSASRRACAAP